MAWPASTTNLQNAFAITNKYALNLKSEAQRLSSDSSAGPVERYRLIDFQKNLDAAITAWAAASALSGITAFVRNEIGNPTLDVTVEFTTMRNAAIALRDWINTNFPRDATTQAVLEFTVAASGVRTALTFTSAQLATFRTHCSTFVATIA